MKIKGIKFSIILLIVCMSFQNSFSAEFLVRDETYTIDTDLPDWEGARKWEFDGVGPANWLSPDDYFNGTFHFRYEIISQPTSRLCGAQFVIWQDWDPPTWLEEAADHVALNGPGDVAYGSGSPADWWMLNDTPLDFSRPHDFWKLGIMVWSLDPFGMIAFYKYETGDPTSVYLWENRADWFPMTIRFTIVAVSAGSTFSGNWAYYMGDVDPGIQPAYTINYTNEETSENVLTQHEYSYDNSTWYDGADSKLSLTPSSTVYFRDKNDNDLTQTLSVPARPAGPTLTIDFMNESTNEVIGTDTEYASSDNMSGAQTGTGTSISVVPGQNLYFRKFATSSAFTSSVSSLTVPARPATPGFAIDYINERTSTTVSSAYEYCCDAGMVEAMTGTGTYVSIVPGESWYFRQLATASSFRSDLQLIIAPARPDAPSFTIDYINETTNELVGADIEYAYSLNMDGAQAGTGVNLVIGPGQDIYFQKMATSSSFSSLVFSLSAPDRPDAGSISIDYENETTVETVGSEIIYADNPEFTGSQTGIGVVLHLTPGEDIYFKLAATASSFESTPSLIISPERPVLTSVSSSPTQDKPIIVDVDFHSTTSSLNSDKLTVNNAILGPITGEYSIQLFPVSKGMVDLKVSANAVAEGNYASEVFSIDYQGVIIGLESELKKEIVLYPNPSQGIFNFNAIGYNNETLRILVFDSMGKLVYEDILSAGQTSLDLSLLEAGIYSLRFINPFNQPMIRKIIIQK